MLVDRVRAIALRAAHRTDAAVDHCGRIDGNGPLGGASGHQGGKPLPVADEAARLEAAVDGALVDAGPPYWLVKKDTAPEDTSKTFPIVEDYEAQWKALWGKS